ncbi:MAG: class I SAM-dependent methyltransferase [Chloroflexota bacterium]
MNQEKNVSQPNSDPTPKQEQATPAATSEVNTPVAIPEIPATPEEQALHALAEDPYTLNADADRVRLVAQTRLFTNYIKANAYRFVGHEAKRILDIGCGEGQLTRIFAQLYPQAEVIGIDKNPKVIEEAQKKAAKDLPNLKFMVGDIQEGLPPGPFDIVYGSAILVHVPNTQKVLQLIHDVLAPGGKFWSKEPDWTVGIPHPAYMEPIKLLYGTIGKRGGHPDIAKEIEPALKDANFDPVHLEQELYPLGRTTSDARIAFSLFAGALYNARTFISQTHGIPEDSVIKMYRDACSIFMDENGPVGKLLLVNYIATRPGIPDADPA